MTDKAAKEQNGRAMFKRLQRLFLGATPLSAPQRQDLADRIALRLDPFLIDDQERRGIILIIRKEIDRFYDMNG